MDRLEPEKKRYIPPEVFYEVMLKREDEIIDALPIEQKDIILNILEGGPNEIPLNSAEAFGYREDANKKAIKELSNDDRQKILDVLEQLEKIALRKLHYGSTKMPLAVRIWRALRGEAQQRFNMNPDFRRHFSSGVFNSIRRILEEFGRRPKIKW